MSYTVFVLQAKAEEVDISNPAPMSDNLIDFTDPTPVVCWTDESCSFKSFLTKIIACASNAVLFRY